MAIGYHNESEEVTGPGHVWLSDSRGLWKVDTWLIATGLEKEQRREEVSPSCSQENEKINVGFERRAINFEPNSLERNVGKEVKIFTDETDTVLTQPEIR